MSYFGGIFLIIFLANAFQGTRQSTIGFEDCGSTATLKDVTIGGCAEVPCDLIKGTNTSVEITFAIVKPAKSMITAVFGVIAGAEVAFKAVSSNSCLTIFDPNGKIGCPQDPKITYVYRNAFEIKKFYPSIDVPVKWTLNDGESKESLICFKVDTIIS